jgi:DNA-binding transcriptional MerR regulator
MSELSRVSGVSIPSVKYYLREGLLPAGRRSAANQADYGDEHVARLRLIRALLDVGGLSVASAREVLAAVDDRELPLAAVFGTAQRAVSRADLYTVPSPGPAEERIDALVAERNWHVSSDNPGRIGATGVVNAFLRINRPELVDLLDRYAEAAEIVARADLAAVAGQDDVAGMAETVVAGTVLGDAMFGALRRMAQEHVTSELYPVPPGGRSAAGSSSLQQDNPTTPTQPGSTP